MMEYRQRADDVRQSLEEMLKLCLQTARRLREVLEGRAQRGQAEVGNELDGATPDEGTE